MRGDQREGRAPDDARGRRRPALSGDLTSATTVRLRSGDEVVVRPIRPSDADALAAGFARLSARSRYQRFLTSVEELSPSQLRYLTDVDHHDHEALISFAEASGEPVGVARFVRNPDGVSAEAAVTVIDEWQGRGLGSALTKLLAGRAREEGIERFTALLLTANRQMQDLLASLGPARVLSREAGTTEVVVELPEEGLGEHLAGLLRAAAGGSTELATPPWGLRQAPDR